MDLTAQLSKASPTKSQVNQLVAAVCQQPGLFSTLVELFLGKDKKVAQRAAWVASHCVAQVPSLATPYLEQLVNNLYKTKNNAIKRNTMRLLQYTYIPEPLWGEVLEKCFEYMRSSNEAIAVKAFSMTVAFQLSHQVPAIRHELKLRIEDMLPYASPGIKSRGTHILHKLASST